MITPAIAVTPTPTPIPSPTLAPILRPLFVDTGVRLALVFGSKVPVVIVTEVEELERLEVGKVDGLERAE
jgi:hypothetical protein